MVKSLFSIELIVMLSQTYKNVKVYYTIFKVLRQKSIILVSSSHFDLTCFLDFLVDLVGVNITFVLPQIETKSMTYRNRFRIAYPSLLLYIFHYRADCKRLRQTLTHLLCKLFMRAPLSIRLTSRKTTNC